MMLILRLMNLIEAVHLIERQALILIMRNITPRNLLYVNRARESFSYEDTFKGQFSQPRPEDDEFTPLYYYKCFWDNNISEPIAHQINSILCSKLEHQLQILRLKLRYSLKSK